MVQKSHLFIVVSGLLILMLRKPVFILGNVHKCTTWQDDDNKNNTLKFIIAIISAMADDFS